MELDNIPSAFQSKVRLAALSALFGGEKDFSTLLKITGATPGNLGRQLELLEAEGYITTRKEFIARRPRTTCAITPKARADFLEYVRLLESLVAEA